MMLYKFTVCALEETILGKIDNKLSFYGRIKELSKGLFKDLSFIIWFSQKKKKNIEIYNKTI